MKQNEMVMKSTLAALMLAALAAGNLAHAAADTGRAVFSADIEAHTTLKCGLSVSVTDPEIPMIYRKGTDGQLGEMAYPGAKEHTIGGNVTGPENCVLGKVGMKVTTTLENISGGARGFKLASGGYWPVSYIVSKAETSEGKLDGVARKSDATFDGLKVDKKDQSWKSTATGNVRTGFGNDETGTNWSTSADKIWQWTGGVPTTFPGLAKKTIQGGVADTIDSITPMSAKSFEIKLSAYHTDHPLNSQWKEDDSAVTDGEKLEATTTLTFTAQ